MSVAGEKTFHDLIDLSDEELVRLARHGTPAEQMRAVWMRGVRLAGLEPRVPGAEKRRIFVINFSVVEDRHALALLAARDDDSLVRVYACQYLARLCSHDHYPVFWDLLLRRSLEDPSASVRASVIRNATLAAITVPGVRLLERWLVDPAAEVSNAAVESLVRWCEAPRQVLHELRDAPMESTRYALQLMREEGRALAWSDIPDEPWAGAAPVLLELVRGFLDRREAPLEFWLGCAVRCHELTRLDDRAPIYVEDSIAAECELASRLLTGRELELVHRALAELDEHVPLDDLDRPYAAPRDEDRDEDSDEDYEDDDDFIVEFWSPYLRLWKLLRQLAPGFARGPRQPSLALLPRAPRERGGRDSGE